MRLSPHLFDESYKYISKNITMINITFVGKKSDLF